MSNKRVISGLIISLLLLTIGYTWYRTEMEIKENPFIKIPKRNAVNLGVSPNGVYANTDNITINDLGSGEVHFYCPSSTFYIHIGNATLILREVNGTIFIEGQITIINQEE